MTKNLNQDELNDYIETKFTPGMNWDNRHLWHIDHNIPCYAWNLENEQDQRMCFSWMNLQPLWSGANLRKSYNYDESEKRQYMQNWLRMQRAERRRMQKENN